MFQKIINHRSFARIKLALNKGKIFFQIDLFKTLKVAIVNLSSQIPTPLPFCPRPPIFWQMIVPNPHRHILQARTGKSNFCFSAIMKTMKRFPPSQQVQRNLKEGEKFLDFLSQEIQKSSRIKVGFGRHYFPAFFYYCFIKQPTAYRYVRKRS